MKAAYSDNWTSIYSVDALTGASLLPEKSVHTIITSPPYWGLRSYLAAGHPDKAMELGAEKTPEEYVEKLTEVFRALRRVLRDDGTLWLNLGDSFAHNSAQPSRSPSSTLRMWKNGGRKDPNATTGAGPRRIGHNLKPKDLVGIPWMVAFALRTDGWYLRSDIIWNKPNPMPESVTDRPTKSHEYMFLLTKSPRYYFDQEAVREAAECDRMRGPAEHADKVSTNGNSGLSRRPINNSRNIRTVWNVATQPYPGAHYATFPPALIYPCIKAGTSERGVCEACGAPWERVVEQANHREAPQRKNNKVGEESAFGRTGYLDFAGSKWQEWKDANPTRTVGWQPTCSCSADTIPATVLDPFMGSGTTALAARKLGRKSTGFDLDERNVKQIEERLGPQGVLL